MSRRRKRIQTDGLEDGESLAMPAIILKVWRFHEKSLQNLLFMTI